MSHSKYKIKYQKPHYYITKYITKSYFFIKKVTELKKYVIIINILNILMEEELNIFKKSSLAIAAIASVLTFAPDLSFVSNQRLNSQLSQ